MGVDDADGAIGGGVSDFWGCLDFDAAFEVNDGGICVFSVAAFEVDDAAFEADNVGEIGIGVAIGVGSIGVAIGSLKWIGGVYTSLVDCNESEELTVGGSSKDWGLIRLGLGIFFGIASRRGP